jgi:uncharacterized protein YecT (DUF1311 family)
MQQVYATELANIGGDDRATFEASQQAFREYRKRASSHAGQQAAGGSLQPMLELLEYERLTHQRIDDLQRILKPWET